MWDGKPDKSWYTDDSPEDDGVYHIKTAAELAGLAELVNGGNDFYDKTVKLDADIVLNETDGWENWGYKAPDGLKEWTPIGTNDSPFSGIFDGQGHTVKGVYIMRKNYAGLFGYLDGGTIQNVGVVESNISGAYIGGIVGYNRGEGEINSCYYTGEVVGNLSGGIIGMNFEGYVSNCYYSDNIGQGVGSESDGNPLRVAKKEKSAFHNGEVATLLNKNGGIDPPVWGQDLSGMNGATYPTIGGPKVIEVVSGIYSNEWKPNDEGIYEIYTVGHLYQFAKKVNDDGMSFQSMEVRLKNNIGLNNTENWESWNRNNAPKNKWTPIGNSRSPFKGTFDGQGHIVKGVYVDGGSDVGFFGIISGGTIRNVGVVESYINGEYAGGIVASMPADESGTFQSCYYTGTVKGIDAGGIVGFNHGSVDNCYYYSTEGNLPGIGNEPNHPEVTQIEDEAAFHNGEVAYLLNAWQGQDRMDWGQKLSDTDAYPTKQDGNNAVYGITFNYTNKDGDETETLICGNAGQLIQEPDDTPMNDNFVWIPKLPDNFPSKNMETYGYILPDETDIDWYNPDANPKEYTITTAAQLRGVSWLSNNKTNFNGWTLRLGANIELNNTTNWTQWNENTQNLAEWTPIGTYDSLFEGFFDGQGHIVKGVYVKEGEMVGLFGCFAGTIRNIGVVESYINGSFAGGIVGVNAGTIQSCYYTGMVEHVVAGGIVGASQDGTVANCYYYSTKEGLHGIGSEPNHPEVTQIEDKAAFHNGEVAYLLNAWQGQDRMDWGQKLSDTDAYPTKQDGNNAVYGITFNYTNKDGDETETLICGNAGQLIQEPDDTPMNDNFVWIPKLPDNFPSKNMETYGYILPDETDIDWYNPDANPKEYTITTAAQLRGVSWLTNNVNNLDFKDWTLRLGANIELNNTEKWEQWNETTEGLNMWEPIGNYRNRFNGTFDGKGYTVGGIYVRDGNDAVGLFGYLGSDGTIWNVGVVKSYIHGDEEAYNGGIVGSNDGKIYSCYNTGIVDYGGVVGGIVGYNKGDIHSCYNAGTAKNGDWVGGIVGINNGKIYSCYNTGDVMDRGNTTIGGIVGELFEDGANTNCFYLKKDGLKGVGAGLSDGTTDKTEAQFHCGEVAWELKQKPAPEGAFPWGQKLGADGNLFPVLGGEAVYKVTFEYPSAANQPATKYIFKYGNTNQLVNLTESELNQIQIPGYQLVWSEELPYNVKLSDVTITADYKQLYTITIPTMPGGSVTANMDKAPAGEEITLTIFPAEGYEYVEGTLTVTNATPTEVVNNGCTFVMPASDVTVTATFQQKETPNPDPEPEPEPSYVTLHFEPNDSVCLEAESDYIEAGGTFVFTATVAEGYDPATLLVEYRKNPYLSWSPLKPAADGSYRLSWVYSDAYVRASVRPMAPTGIDVITGTQVYTESGTVVVRTAARARVTIVSLFGTTLYAREQEGTERYTDLTSGVYIVRVGDHTYKVRVR